MKMKMELKLCGPTMRFISCSILSALAGTVSAAPFLVSAPYPVSGPQPTEFVITLVGQPVPIVSPAVKNAQNEAYLKWDIGGQTGQKTITAKARNAWGESPESSPFVYVAGVPVSPTGLMLAP